jgi:DNA-binding MarR family transcriptional regulator
MSKGGMSKLIDRLVKRKLVRKDVSEFDRRVRAVGLTAYGKDWVFLQSDYYCEESERKAFWDELCSDVAAAAALRSSA